MDRGQSLEEIIADFNSRFFMKDFVFLNPKFTDSGGEKESADMLLVLKDQCMVVSIKGTDGRPKQEMKLESWLKKALSIGGRQAKGGIRSLSRVSFAARNLWGEERRFEAKSLGPICGIILLECSQRPFDSVELGPGGSRESRNPAAYKSYARIP
jgi:hypothetical protein